MLRACADTREAFQVIACSSGLEGEKKPGGFRENETLRGDGAIGDYSSSVSSDSY